MAWTRFCLTTFQRPLEPPPAAGMSPKRPSVEAGFEPRLAATTGRFGAGAGLARLAATAGAATVTFLGRAARFFSTFFFSSSGGASCTGEPSFSAALPRSHPAHSTGRAAQRCGTTGDQKVASIYLHYGDKALIAKRDSIGHAKAAIVRRAYLQGSQQ